MPRPTSDSAFPFTRGAVSSMTGASVPVIKNLLRGIPALKKRHRGSGHWSAFDLDDALRVAVARELLRVGVQVAAIASVFAAIERDWPRLKTPQARTEGAVLVLVLGHPLGSASAQTGHVHLATAIEAKAWALSKRTVILTDVNALIAHLEDVTGLSYQTVAPAQERVG